MKRNLRRIIIVIVVLLATTGCGRATELNELSIATGTGIDGKKEIIRSLIRLV
ncbi:hypothetical protein D3C81_1861160 [compost metagenome]